MAKKRVLLIDDEESFTRVLRLNLENSGLYQVREENRASNALAAAREFHPDLVLLDIMMPEVAGDEIAARFKADPVLERIPIVFLTAVASREEVRALRGFIGGYGVLAKPASSEEVMACIAIYIGVPGGCWNQSVHPAEPFTSGPPLLPERSPTPPGPSVRNGHAYQTRDLILSILALLLATGGYLGYRLYDQSQRVLRDTLTELKTTRSRLSTLAYVPEPATRERVALTRPADGAAETQASELVLPEAPPEHSPARVAPSSESAQPRMSLSRFAASVVKLQCRSKADSNQTRRGSGILYRTGRNRTEMGPFHIQTSLHVVETTDGSDSICTIYLYPDQAKGDEYVLYVSLGFRFFRNDIDVAFLEPEMLKGAPRAGTFMDLEASAREEAKNPLCDTAEIGDRLSILGYPGAGGETLTVTEGIISGFELDGGNRYIKSSAKLERGNSGGAAVKDSGCVVGIPSFVQRGQLESIGRVLDLKHLYSVTLK